MAATKASKAKAAKAGKSANRNGGGSRSKPAATRKAATRRKRATKSTKASSRPSANGVLDGAKAVGEAVGDAGQSAGHAVSEAASKAKVPLIAGGAALLGAASGVAITAAARSNGTRVLGVKPPKPKIKGRDIARTADRMASAGEQIGRLSSGFRELQGSSQNGGRRRRSPIEVVLEGLTSRG